MAEKNMNDSMLDMYIFETSQLIEQLEQLILATEESNFYSTSDINEIFRIMHTIKGSSAMMVFNNISVLAHAMEDLFYYIREEEPKNINYSSLSDLVFEGIDFIKVEVQKVKNNDEVDGNAAGLIEEIKKLLESLKSSNAVDKVNNTIENTKEISIENTENENTISEENETSKEQSFISKEKVCELEKKYSFKAVIRFEDDCGMENFRAFSVVNNLKDIVEEYYHFPEEVIEDDSASEIIKENGFIIYFNSNSSYDDMYKFFVETTVLLKSVELLSLKENNKPIISLKDESDSAKDNANKLQGTNNAAKDKEAQGSGTQNIISVNMAKLDKLMDLVGEMVIAEAMVTENPDLKGLELDNFKKASRQLHKITSELQDIVMSIRMVPLAATFNKMHRIVRDMNKKLSKDVKLEVIGEETEVDKNIIEHISDPLMHLIRNSLDHGIETVEERKRKGKLEPAKVTLEARNVGGDVLVLVKDNGKGLDKEKILDKARKNGILTKPESEMLDKEIYNLIFLPGFSTKESVSEFSGRGVGMDVVTNNIQAIGGNVTVNSVPNEGSTITLKIPLTLAIIDGMNVKVGRSKYTIPIVSIKQSFRANEKDLIKDPDGNEMIMVRGECYSLIRLHELYKVQTRITNVLEGIVLMVESESKTICIFVDELVGEQQVVVKALPKYIRNIKNIKGIMGCTLLGDGSISLILDVAAFVK